MTRKDYKAIADAIREKRQRMDNNAIVRATVAILIDALADVLAADNPRFDRSRFFDACEPVRTV